MSEPRRPRPTQAELKTVFGYDGGRLVHVSEVGELNRRSIRCVRCDGSLVARLGKKYRHHFGHMTTCECDGGRETAIHVFSKEALLRRRSLTLPECMASVPTSGLSPIEFPRQGASHRWSEGGGARFEQAIKPSQVVTFDDVALEVIHDGFRPDAVATKGGRGMAVEFANTHFSSPDKITRLVAANLSAVEVDVSAPPFDLSPKDLERWVLDEAPRRWLHNGRIAAWEAGLRAEVQAIVDAKRRAEAAKAEQERRDAARRGAAVDKAKADVARDLATGVDPVLDNVPNDVQGRVGSKRLAWAASWQPPYKTFFRVSSRVWQLHVLSELINGHKDRVYQGRMLAPGSIARHLMDLGLSPGAFTTCTSKTGGSRRRRSRTSSDRKGPSNTTWNSSWRWAWHGGPAPCTTSRSTDPATVQSRLTGTGPAISSGPCWPTITCRMGEATWRRSIEWRRQGSVPCWTCRS